MDSYKLFNKLFLLLLAFSVGCSKIKTNDSITALPTGDVNKTIVMIAPDGWNYYIINSEIGLSVILQGEEPVIISPNALHVFEWSSDKWICIDNKINEEQVGFILYPSDSYFIKSGAFFVQPRFNDESVPITLRFVVTGNLYQDNKIGEKVSAYVDVTLSPYRSNQNFSAQHRLQRTAALPLRAGATR
jgi:hypothetical protein